MDPLGGVFFIYFFYIFSSNSILDESVLKSVIKPQGHPNDGFLLHAENTF